GPLGFQQVLTLNQPSSVALFPLPRQNALIVAAPRSQMANIIRQIKNLDVPNTADFRVFPLEHAPAARAAQAINTFYSTRYGPETAAQHQIRILFDDQTNTVFVQAAPADLTDIAALIKHIDQAPNPATNEW